MPKARSKTSKSKIDSTANAVKSLELRKKGCSYREIARELKISVGVAHKYVSAALAELNESLKEETEQLRAIELERLDDLQIGIWKKAIGGDLFALDRVLKIMAQRAELTGIKAPTKIAPTTPDGENSYQSMSDEELKNRISELQSKLAIDESNEK